MKDQNASFKFRFLGVQSGDITGDMNFDEFLMEKNLSNEIMNSFVINFCLKIWVFGSLGLLN